MSIIDALTSGFNTVARRLWLILIPVILDLFVWLGPRMSIARLVRRLEPLLTPQASMNLSNADAYNLAMSRAALIEMGENFNLFSLLSNTFLGVPNFMAVSPLELSSSQPSLGEVANGWVGLVLVIVLVLLSIFIACLYLELMAQIVKANGVNLKSLPRRVVSVAGRIIVLGFILLLVIAILILPISIFLTLIALVSQGLAVMLLGLFSLMIFWGSIMVMVYLFYFVDDLLINENGLLQAVWNSMLMVRQNLWSTIGLILLTNVLSTGLLLIWQRLAFAPWGVAIAILGNAFIGSGLVAAIMIFYQSRYRKWQEELGQASQTA